MPNYNLWPSFLSPTLIFHIYLPGMTNTFLLNYLFFFNVIIVLIHSFSFFLSLFPAALGLHRRAGFSLVVASGGYSLLQSVGFSVLWLLLLPSMGSRAPGVQ